LATRQQQEKFPEPVRATCQAQLAEELAHLVAQERRHSVAPLDYLARQWRAHSAAVAVAAAPPGAVGRMRISQRE
jgi:hypothetical protein